MRGVLAVVIVLSGCGVSRERFDAQVIKTQRAQAQHLQERERSEALREQLLQVLRTTEVLLSERDRLQARVATLEHSLSEAEDARQELMELNVNLSGQRARLSQLTEQLSSTWYDSALDRARRALTEPPAPLPAAGEAN